LEGRIATSRITLNVSSHGRRTIVGDAVGIGSARSAATILHAVGVSTANGVGSASSDTDVGFADGLTRRLTTISVPGVTGGTVSISSAV